MKQMGMLGLALILLRVVQIQKKIIQRQFNELVDQNAPYEDTDELRDEIKTLELIEHDLKAVT